MDLREYLLEYRALTLDAMEKVDKDSTLVTLIDQRGEILKIIMDCSYNNEEIKKIADEIGLLRLEEELKDMLISERDKTKKEMLLLKKKQQANDKYISYGNLGHIKSRFDKRF